MGFVDAVLTSRQDRQSSSALFRPSMLSLKENTELENVTYHCLWAALKCTTSLTHATCCRGYFIALQKYERIGVHDLSAAMASHPLYRYKCLNCDLQLSYLSLNMIETLSMQVMYRVTMGAIHCSAEFRCEISDIWNCGPWLDIHHKSIDLISNDL